MSYTFVEQTSKCSISTLIPDVSHILESELYTQGPAMTALQVHQLLHRCHFVNLRLAGPHTEAMLGTSLFVLNAPCLYFSQHGFLSFTPFVSSLCHQTILVSLLIWEPLEGKVQAFPTPLAMQDPVSFFAYQKDDSIYLPP